MMITTTILPNPAGPRFGGVMVVGKSTQLSSAPSRKVDHRRSMKVVLACTGTSGTSRIVSGLRGTNAGEIALVTDAVGHVSFGKGQSFGYSSEPEGVPNKPLPPALVWDPLNMSGKELARASHVSDVNASGVQNTVTELSVAVILLSIQRKHFMAAPGTHGTLVTVETAWGILMNLLRRQRTLCFLNSRMGLINLGSLLECLLPLKEILFSVASLLSDLNSVGTCYTIGQLSMNQNQLPGGTIQATCMLKPIQFKVPYVGVTFDPFRRSASRGVTTGFCEPGYAESAYGGMSFDPFWESALITHKEKAIQVHASQCNLSSCWHP